MKNIEITAAQKQLLDSIFEVNAKRIDQLIVRSFRSTGKEPHVYGTEYQYKG